MHYMVKKQHKLCKKDISKEFIPVAWPPTRWLDWCMLVVS